MKDYFLMFAQYNRWANGRLYDAARHLDEDQMHRDMGAYFSSLNGTLNHVLVADRIWMSRFTGEGEPPDALDLILYEDFPELREARMEEDERIIGVAERFTEKDLETPIRYRALNRSIVIEQPIRTALGHFFNHQTHHRGQAHCLISQLKGDAPPLDLAYYQRESGTGME